jgi:hypothetical protein
MAKSLLSANPNKFDLSSFVPFIHDKDAAVNSCYDLVLIPKSQINICNAKVSPIANKFFSKVMLSKATQLPEGYTAHNSEGYRNRKATRNLSLEYFQMPQNLQSNRARE